MADLPSKEPMMWTSIADALPPSDPAVLVTDGAYIAEAWCRDGVFINTVSGDEFTDASHWMAAPELPERLDDELAHESRAQRCAALNSADPPQDCNAPFCGCNPEWTKCIEWLLECGWKSPDDLRDGEP